MHSTVERIGKAELESFANSNQGSALIVVLYEKPPLESNLLQYRLENILEDPSDIRESIASLRVLYYEISSAGAMVHIENVLKIETGPPPFALLIVGRTVVRIFADERDCYYLDRISLLLERGSSADDAKYFEP